jgi:hypothetical protein
LLWDFISSRCQNVDISSAPACFVDLRFSHDRGHFCGIFQPYFGCQDFGSRLLFLRASGHIPDTFLFIDYSFVCMRTFLDDSFSLDSLRRIERCFESLDN